MKARVFLASAVSMDIPSLNQEYSEGGEPSCSEQVSTALLPMVTEEGTLTAGLDGGTRERDNKKKVLNTRGKRVYICVGKNQDDSLNQSEVPPICP